MNILDGTIGFVKRITGINQYMFVYHKNKELICTYYNTEKGMKLIKKYLKKINISENDVDFIVKDKIKDEQDKHEFNVFKIVMINDEPILYNQVVRLAKTKEVEGFDYKQPGYGLNQYHIHNESKDKKEQSDDIDSGDNDNSSQSSEKDENKKDDTQQNGEKKGGDTQQEDANVTKAAKDRNDSANKNKSQNKESDSSSNDKNSEEKNNNKEK